MNSDKETFDTWNKIADLYEEKFMDLDLYNESYDFICSAIDKKNAKLLEIGCGPGNIARYLLSKRPDFDIFGIDVAPNMIELAKKNNPSAKFVVMDSREIHTLTERYDGIVVGFCLPYLSDAESEALIFSSYDLLNDGGLLYLSFVEGNPADSGFKTGSGGRVFFQYHLLDKLKEQLSAAKFDEIETFKVEFPRPENQVEMHTILVAKKKNDI